MLTRRSLFGAIAAPAIVQYCNIMPVRALQPPEIWTPRGGTIVWDYRPAAGDIWTQLKNAEATFWRDSRFNEAWLCHTLPVTAASSGSPDQPRWA